MQLEEPGSKLEEAPEESDQEKPKDAQLAPETEMIPGKPNCCHYFYTLLQTAFSAYYFAISFYMAYVGKDYL